MTEIYIQWTDSTKTAIASVFSCAQDPTVWQNQDVIPSNDERYASHFNAMPSSIQSKMVAPGT
ncbi:hypothetical protein [Trinickia dinghuensis]|uniref:Uncharacterized protein n=1 Tax=Trinickia dinghuensis TaxID=2291023 RepID=A0A3D8K3R1_9BURK|nr:hypothetical protein [Trinickia dinghuensis]RDU99241.1 hypothetical protein DWV00_08965 [Trinickia dinghuensis]